MSAWPSRAERWFQTRTELANLALFQTLFCGGLALQILVHFREQLEFLHRRRAFEAVLDLRGAYGAAPPLLGLVQVPELGATASCVVGGVLVASLVGAALGVRARLLVGVALATWFLYFGQIQELDYVRRKANLLPFVLWILLMAPGLGGTGPRAAARALRSPGSETTPVWPLVLVKLTLASAYFAAGVSKLLNTGWSWAGGDVLRANLAEQAIAKDLPLAAWLAGQPELCALASVATLALELGFWTVLFVPRLGPLYAVAGLSLHAGIQLSMGIPYLKYWGLVYLVFVDLAVLRWLLQALPSGLLPSWAAPAGR